jgi:hypothetical protein
LDGIDDISVPVSSTPYVIIIDWYWDEEDWDDQTVFQAVYVTTPGQVIRLHY